MIYKFTSRAEKALELANDLAMELGHNYIGTEHLLYGLAKEGTGVASKVIEMQDVTPEQIKRRNRSSNWSGVRNRCGNSRIYTKNQKSYRKCF